MPIVVNEVVVRGQVESPPAQDEPIPDVRPPAVNERALIEACVDEVLEILERRGEREAMADGFLVKLSIVPYEDSENVQVGPPAGPPFVAQFNPESFSVTNEVKLGPEEPAHGDDGDEAKFKSIKPRTFAFEFLLDGTGVSGPAIEVLAQVEHFRFTVGFSGVIHRPRFLVLTWGSFIATCVVENFTINYRLFRPDGTPLRATLSVTFREHKPAALKELLKNLSSPDVEHAHDVTDGEHLSLITYRVYKDPRYYYHVAEANELDTLRHVDAGRRLSLPPLA